MRAPSELSNRSGKRKSLAAAAFESQRFLVADDDPLTSQLLSVFENEGYEIAVVDNGRDAFRVLKVDADFRVAVVNIILPYIKGIEIIRYMRTDERLQHIPVLVISNGNSLRLLAESFATGAIALLPKPLASRQLQHVVRLALNLNFFKR